MTIKLNLTGFIIYFLIGFYCTIFISLDHHSFFVWKLPVTLPAYYEIMVLFFLQPVNIFFGSNTGIHYYCRFSLFKKLLLCTFSLRWSFKPLDHFSKGLRFTGITWKYTASYRKAAAVKYQAQRNQRTICSFFLGMPMSSQSIVLAAAFKICIGQII